MRVAPPAPYVYRSPVKRAAARALDLAGRALSFRPSTAVAWSRVERVAVLRLDHLGDLLHLLPFLRRLRTALPQARIDLWTGPWGRELASLFADVDTVRVSPAPWFERPLRKDWPWADIRGLAQGLKAQGYGAAFEPRGDLRHHLALWGACIPVRAGHAVTAGGFLLTHEARWDAALHEQDQALALLDQAGLPPGRPLRTPYLKLTAAARGEAEGLAKELKLGRRTVMVQAACGTQAKRWSQASWAAVLDALPAGTRVCLLGSAAEKEEITALASKLKRPPAMAAGRLSLSGLAAFLQKAQLLISVDSGPAHLAAVQGVPVLSLFSGTNRASQWAPRGPKVKVLQAQGLPCSPCELSDCPYGNACMAALKPEEVLKEARRMLKAR